MTRFVRSRRLGRCACACACVCREIKSSSLVEFGAMVGILVGHCNSKERFNRLTAVQWVHEFIKLGVRHLFFVVVLAWFFGVGVVLDLAWIWFGFDLVWQSLGFGFGLAWFGLLSCRLRCIILIVHIMVYTR